MIVWSLSVIVTYQDGYWTSTNLTYDNYGFKSIGPDVSKLPEIKDLLTSLGFSPVSDAASADITEVVFRFSVTTTNGHINVLGDTETIDIITNNQEEVVEQLANNLYFTQSLTAYSWLDGVLINLNLNYDLVTELIPNVYHFWDDTTFVGAGEGVETYRGIEDGGDDMYDGANYMNTNLTQLYVDVKDGEVDNYDNKALASIPYTHTQALDEDDDNEYIDPPKDGAISSGTNYFGAGSSYFTNMYPGLFIMVADNINIDEFSVTGDVGSDGEGTNAAQINPIGTKDWTLLFKSNHDDEDYEFGDPTINHLIMVPGNSDGLTYSIEASASFDDHCAYGLTGRSGIIYAVVATAPEAGPITPEEATTIASRLLDVIYGSPIAPTSYQFNPARVDEYITLSNSNLTATAEAQIFGTDGTTALTNKIIKKGEKKIFSMTIDTYAPYEGYTGVGIANASFPVYYYLGEDVNSIGLYDGGECYTNDDSVGEIDVQFDSDGSVVTVAVDRENDLIWFKVGNGYWNGDSSQNPATTAGGIDISSVLGDVYPGACPYYNEGTEEIFGQTSLSQVNGTIPAGFTAIQPNP